MLASPTGRILWYWRGLDLGVAQRGALVQHVRAALARAPKAPASASRRGAGARRLAGPAGRSSPAGGPAARQRSRRSPRGYALCVASRSSSTRGRRGAHRAARNSGCSRSPQRITGATSLSSAPTPTTPPETRGRSWPSIRSATRAIRPAPEPRFAGGHRGPSDYNFHRPRRTSGVCAHGPVRLARFSG